MAKHKTINENKIFYPKPKFIRIVLAILLACQILFMLNLTIVKLEASLRGDVLNWEASWWLAALCFLLYVLLLAKLLHEIFIIRLVLSPKGVWYYQLGNKKYISWEQVERVGTTKSYINGIKEYGLI